MREQDLKIDKSFLKRVSARRIARWIGFTIPTGFEESNCLSMIIQEVSDNVTCWDLGVLPLIDFKECRNSLRMIILEMSRNVKCWDMDGSSTIDGL